MKLNQEVLLEIMAIVQDGLMSGVDISQRLRELDLVVTGESQDTLTLSVGYKRERGRT